MVSVQPLQNNSIRDDYQNPGSRAIENINKILDNERNVPSVSVNERDIITPRIYDALSRIQELVEKGVDSTSIIGGTSSVIGFNQGYFQGTLNAADPSKYEAFEGRPSGAFDVYTPNTISDSDLKDIVRRSVQPGGIYAGNEKLFRALNDNTAKIYNQGEAENLIGKSVDWKQGSISGSMIDRTAINEKYVQQLEQSGKQIFSGSIGSIRFAVVY